jgi:hypothetical protein
MKAKSSIKSNVEKAKKPEVEEAPRTTTVSVQTGPMIIDGYLHFSPYDLARLELAQAKVVNATQADKLKRAEGDQARRVYEDTIRKLNDELAYILAAGKVAESELRALQKEFEAAYKLDFTQVTYDDKTGKISVLGSPVPED